MIFINFKTYKEGTGEGALAMIKALQEIAQQSQVRIIPVVQAADVKEAVFSSTLEIWTQKVDPVSYGAHTGAVLAEAVVEDGAVGTFLNHSEAKFASIDELKEAISRAKAVGLKTLVFASSLDELGQVALLAPTYLAFEPPELIGSATVSVASAQPEMILKAVEVAKAHELPLIVGAGIHSQEDVRKSLQFGASGIAVAKDIMMAADPKKELLDLVEGFK